MCFSIIKIVKGAKNIDVPSEHWSEPLWLSIVLVAGKGKGV